MACKSISIVLSILSIGTFPVLTAGCSGDNDNLDTASLAPGVTIPTQRPAVTPEPDYQVLFDELMAVTDDADGSYGIYVYELISGYSFGINEDVQFTAASTNKVPLLMMVYSELERGSISMDELLTYQYIDYEGGTGNLQFEAIGSSWTVRDLVYRMVKDSDNVAKNIFLRHFGIGNVQSFVDQLGVENVAILENLATPESMGSLLRGICENKVTSKPYSDEMLSLMIGTEFEDRIPRYLDGIPVAHKTGNWEGAVSDVGIVYLPGRPFIICIYSEGTSSDGEAEETIASISRIVYDFENRLLLRQLLEQFSLLNVLQSLYTD